MTAFLLAPGESQLLHGLEEQQAFGAALLDSLPASSVLFLEGELGAGKTSLTQGIARRLGFTGTVSSPTYALMQPYPTPQGQLLHVDAYRVQHPGELYDMGLEELTGESRLSVIEWGQLLYDDYPQAPCLLLEHLPGDPSVRRVTRLR
ncbi:tRNA (adenosine(37)-N6)-threonylcarbamoyltransferase complex ATPase subunit type 1 TsaE [Deinococcus sp. Marseille-Q6407]|uniref:tRNA (adenosine(37)-N6)-threonylcarbamoyltransferase complex ATPase subunit type 1 TsaE n=1 Tax=Deinococcus sp. Marseille-Q6407 TaxID=2969223 RepID=UPI0021C120DC|nr:tRNA (adenosine(37)-N6)-threonylcarbamoyltransferase complex ATPase subunit type 1 TsaE [Deinococcus sp. Marseille-Q6407]